MGCPRIPHMPGLAVLILFVEFCERFAYYGIVYTFTTFTLVMLDSSVSMANAVVNVIFILAPLSATAAAVVADGRWGRAATLSRSAILYAVALICLFASALPYFFSDFPNGPTIFNRGLFVLGLVTMGVGYGGVKTCTAPLLGEVLEDAHKRLVENAIPVSTGFAFYFWAVNIGALGGTLINPFLRGVAGPKVPDPDTGKNVTTGYFVAYGLCAVLVTIAAGVFTFNAWRYSVLRPEPTNVFKMIRTAARITWDGIKARCGRASTGDESADRYAAAVADENDCSHLKFNNKDGSVSGGNGSGSSHSGGAPAKSGRGINQPLVPSEAWEAEAQAEFEFEQDVRQALRVCQLFSILPFFWMIQNQGLSNVVVQAETVELPSYLPPEVFNNVATISVLFLVPIVNIVARKIWGQNPPYKARMLIGFCIAAVEIFYSAFVQYMIEQRGTVSEAGDFTPFEGKEALSGAYIIPTYFLNGAASSFVDPTTLEAAFVMAPSRTKSFVMAMYLFASSAAGFLGLLFTPLAIPSRFTVMFLAMGAMLIVACIPWFCLSPDRAVARHADDVIGDIEDDGTVRESFVAEG